MGFTIVTLVALVVVLCCTCYRLHNKIGSVEQERDMEIAKMEALQARYERLIKMED